MTTLSSCVIFRWGIRIAFNARHGETTLVLLMVVKAYFLRDVFLRLRCDDYFVWISRCVFRHIGDPTSAHLRQHGGVADWLDRTLPEALLRLRWENFDDVTLLPNDEILALVTAWCLSLARVKALLVGFIVVRLSQFNLDKGKVIAIDLQVDGRGLN